MMYESESQARWPMAIRRILVPMSGRYDPDDPESLDSSGLEIGLKLGQQLQAHVEALCVTGPPREPEKAFAAWIPGYGIRQLIEIVEKEGAARHQRARSAFDAAIRGMKEPPAITSDAVPGFTVEFTERAGDIRETIGIRGRLADLVVTANSPERWRWNYRPILDAALRDTGRPLLVSAPNAPPRLDRRIAIAWNGSIEASRAVAALLDVIQPGAELVILSVAEDGTAAESLQDVADYLRWHGLDAASVELEGGARSGGDLILSRALETGCDLLVMGACIHSHARHVVFGSMTETVLSSAQISALMVT